MFKESFYKDKMNKSLDVFSKELQSLRTGRANLISRFNCRRLCTKNANKSISSITIPEPRTINIQVWDLNNVALIDSSIRKSELGLNLQTDGQLIRLPIPDLWRKTYPNENY